MKESLLFKKVYGCLLGGAIGNGMGSPVEGKTYEEIEKKHGRITTLLDPSRLESEDDNAIALLLCQAYIEKNGRITSEDLAKVWLKSMEPKRFFWCMRNTYELLKRGVSSRLTGIHNIVTGSAIMAIAPCGIYNACDPNQAFIDAIDIGYMYQPKLDVDCGCVLAAAIAEAMKSNSKVESVISCALEMAPDEPYVSFDEREPDNIRDTLKKTLDIARRFDDVFEVRKELYKNILQWNMIDPLEVLCLSMAIFQVSRGDTRKAIIGGTNVGRDADTIANLCGALCGALNGIESIPKEWIDLVSPGTIERFHGVSERMTKLIEDKAKKMDEHSKMLISMMGKRNV